MNSTEKPDPRPWVVSVPALFANLPAGACFSSMDPNMMQIDYVKVSEDGFRRAGFFMVWPADELRSWRYAEQVPVPDDFIDGPELERLRQSEAEHAMMAREEEARQREQQNPAGRS